MAAAFWSSFINRIDQISQESVGIRSLGKQTHFYKKKRLCLFRSVAVHHGARRTTYSNSFGSEHNPRVFILNAVKSHYLNVLNVKVTLFHVNISFVLLMFLLQIFVLLSFLLEWFRRYVLNARPFCAVLMSVSAICLIIKNEAVESVWNVCDGY